jgi:hypothetical protein
VKTSTSRARTTTSVAAERTTHLACNSCQTCLGISVCLTQHSSGTLWPFRELIFHTSCMCILKYEVYNVTSYSGLKWLRIRKAGEVALVNAVMNLRVLVDRLSLLHEVG